MKFSFQEKGTGETIVLIHSYLWDSEMWREQIDLLSKKYHCLAIDLPSHGKENFDLKNILKRLKTKSDYSDFMLKFIQSVPVNLSLNIKTLY